MIETGLDNPAIKLIATSLLFMPLFFASTWPGYVAALSRRFSGDEFSPNNPKDIRMRGWLAGFSMKTMRIQLLECAVAGILSFSLQAMVAIDASAAGAPAPPLASRFRPGGPLKQSREDQPAGKQKGLHEIGPEDLFPQTRPQGRRAEREKAATRPSTAKNIVGDKKAAPAPAPSAPASALPMSIPSPAALATENAPIRGFTRPGKAATSHWMLMATLVSLAGVLLMLVFVVGKLRRQNRKGALHRLPENKQLGEKVGQSPQTESLPIMEDSDFWREIISERAKSRSQRARNI